MIFHQGASESACLLPTQSQLSLSQLVCGAAGASNSKTSVAIHKRHNTLEICTQKTLGTVNPHSYIGDMFQVQRYLGFTNPCIILSKCLWLKVVSLQPSAMMPNVYNMAEAHQPLHAFRTVDPLVFLLLLGNFFGCCKVILPASASVLKSVSTVCSPLAVPGGLQH